MITLIIIIAVCLLLLIGLIMTGQCWAKLDDEIDNQFNINSLKERQNE